MLPLTAASVQLVVITQSATSQFEGAVTQPVVAAVGGGRRRHHHYLETEDDEPVIEKPKPVIDWQALYDEEAEILLLAA